MLKQGGAKNTTVLTDFDQTLTRLYLPDGSSADSVFKTIIKYNRTPKSVQDLTTQLFNKFYPLEQDPNISMEEKLTHLDEWWNRDMAAFVTAGFNKTDFAHMTMTSKLIFRRSTLSLFNECKQASVPIIVLSGGIHELIEAAFKILSGTDATQNLDHVRIVSNRFTYNDLPAH